MDKENPFCGGKYRTETEKETYIWKRIYFWVEEKKNGERGGGKYFCIGQDKRSKKKRKMFLHGKRKKTQKKKEEHIFFCGGEGKGENYLEKGNTFLKRRRSTEKEMEENIMGKEKLLHSDGKCYVVLSSFTLFVFFK